MDTSETLYGIRRSSHPYSLVPEVENLFGPDIFLPSQLADRCRPRTEIDGTRRLMLAILEDAVESCLKHRRRKVGKRAREWIEETDDTWIFSFESICAVLNIDPDGVRRGLRALDEAEAMPEEGGSHWRARNMTEAGLRRRLRA